jgi:hypothetical protein
MWLVFLISRFYIPLTVSVKLTRCPSDKMHDAYTYAKFYNPPELFTVQKVTVLFRGAKYLQNINAFI